MVQALYLMHRGFLSLSVATADGLKTIMIDYYKSQEGEFSECELRACVD